MELVDIDAQARIHWNILQEAGIVENHEYDSLYSHFKNAKVKSILSTLHHELISLFNYMNSKLPVRGADNYYRANESRRLIACIDAARSLQGALKDTQERFQIDGYYDDLFSKCRDFLRESYGSEIPKEMERIKLSRANPIFISPDTLVNEIVSDSFEYPLKECGSGSYAHVYKYKDEFYGKWYVLKRARKGLSDKEIFRFKKEFDTMKQLNSPYIVEVYKYMEHPYQYTMEYMDYTVMDYIQTNNSKLDINARLSIVRQVLRAFKYVHQKEILHRDISPKNVLIKEYEDTLVVKLSDFGLVKTPNSTLTSFDSDIKGALNDPQLRQIGFDKYAIEHEIYALTLLVSFIMTGKTNISNIKQPELKEFVYRGTSADTSNRYRDVSELQDSFNKIAWY